MPHASATARTNQMRALMGGAFLPSFLGLAATRVWLQVNLFASYTQSDDGLFTVVNNLAYGLVMVIGAAIALRKPFSKGNRTAVAWLGFAVMTFSTVLILAGKETGAVDILAVASVCAGIGGALGGGMWTAAYVRLGLRQSVLYGFLSLALGSLGGLALSFLPEALSYTVSMFMPAIALLCYQRAMKTDVGPQPAPEPIYDKEPRSTMLFIFGGLAVFGLALGISRGFPAGEPVPMDALQRVVHQMGVVVISLFIIWWFIVKRKRLSFSFLWRIEIMLVAAGMLILSVFPGHFTGLAIATVNIADTLMLGVLWITLQDVARHTTTDVYAVYGFAWASRVLSRDAGRVLIMVLGAMGGLVVRGDRRHRHRGVRAGRQHGAAAVGRHFEAAAAVHRRRGGSRPAKRGERGARGEASGDGRGGSLDAGPRGDAERAGPAGPAGVVPRRVRPLGARDGSGAAHRPGTQQVLHRRGAVPVGEHGAHARQERLHEARRAFEAGIDRPAAE